MDLSEKPRLELRHEPVKGFDKAFYIVLTVAVAYMGVIVWRCF